MCNLEEIQNENLLEQKIYSLSGYSINKRLILLCNAVLVFQGNMAEVLEWHKKLNDPSVALTLWNIDNYSLLNKANLEMQRRFSNYLLSAYSVRDHLYAIKREYYEGTDVLSEINELTKDTFDTSEIASFMQDLRNYVTHKGYPLVDKELSFTSGGISNDVWFDKDQLRKFHYWKKLSRRYIDRMTDRVKLIDLVHEYSQLIDAYYKKVISVLVKYHEEELEELRKYKNRYGLKMEIVKGH